MTPTEFDLRSFLDDESENVDATGNFATAVFAAKRRSDHRRALAGGVAAVAAVALAVPLAWTNLSGRGTVAPATSGTVSTAPTGTSTPPPTSTSTATETTPAPAVTTTAMVKDAAAVGRPTLSASAPFVDPGIPYAVSGTIHDGSATVEAPVKGGFPDFQRLDNGGYLVKATSGADQKVYIVRPDGSTKVIAGATGGVVSHDRTRIAWTDGSAVLTKGAGRVHIADSDGAEIMTVKVDGSPTALVGDQLYAVNLAGYDYAGTSVRIDLDSGRRTTIQGNVVFVGAGGSLALATGTVPDDPDGTTPAGSCYRVLDVSGDQPATRLSACGDVMPYAISSDDRFLLARLGSVVIDAATGRILLDAVGRSGLNVEAATMSDENTSLVMSVSSADYSRSGLVKCTLDGDCTQVGGPSVKQPAPDDVDSPRVAFGVARS